MTLYIHKDWTWRGLTWSFILWLESVAVSPQITIINTNNGTLAYIAHYLAALGSHRFFYIFLWIYRYIKFGILSYVSYLVDVYNMLISFIFILTILDNLYNPIYLLFLKLQLIVKKIACFKLIINFIVFIHLIY